MIVPGLNVVLKGRGFSESTGVEILKAANYIASITVPRG